MAGVLLSSDNSNSGEKVVLSCLLECYQKTCKMVLNTLIANLRFLKDAVLTHCLEVCKQKCTVICRALYQIQEINKLLTFSSLCVVKTEGNRLTRIK